MTKRSSNKALAYPMALFVLAALLVPFVGTAAANHPTACLDLFHTEAGEGDESESNTVGETHEVTAVLRTRDLTAARPGNACNSETEVEANNGAVNIDFRIEGANDPNPLNTSGTADFSCDIPEGSSSCTFVYTGDRVGTDLIRGWVDHDKFQSTVTEADDTEGLDDTTQPGEGDQCSSPANTPAEPDCTDVVQKTWTAGPAAAVDCDDSGPPDTERELNPSNEGSASTETYTCTVTDARGNRVGSGETVYGEVENGINDPDANDGPSYGTPDYGCTTTSSGSCTVPVTQNEGETGTAEICFWIDPDDQGPGTSGGAACADEPTGEAQNPDGSDSANDRADQVEKTWETRRASAIDAEPESDTNQPGEDHTVTATVFDQFGTEFEGNTKIDFEFFQGSPSDTDGNTPASPDRSCTTNNSNTCSITYTSQERGTDLICVYPDNSRPAMQGNNTNGTCDGEGLTDPDDDPASPDAPDRNAETNRVDDDQDVVQKRWAAPGEATRLDCTPETDRNPTGSSHTITCTARDQNNNTVSGANVDAEATGANDPDGNSETTSPDFSCTTDDNGNCSFTHGGSGTGSTNEPGTTTYRAWIDSDNNDTSSEADQTEGQNESTAAGNEAESDNTDVVTKSWTGDARRIECTPENARNELGTTHTVTCTVTDSAGQPVSGESVTFTEQGVGQIQGSNTSTTDQNGRATVQTTSNEAGEQTITGTITDDTTGTEPGEVDECDRPANEPTGAPAGQCSDTVNKTWGASRARTIDCEPETATNPTGTEHVVTCTVRDSAGQPASGESVTFTEAGPGTVSPTQATTDQNGVVRTTATSTQPGEQTITGTITADTVGSEPSEVDECDRAANDPQGATEGQCADSVTKTWTGEQAPECSDGIDNDNDGETDYPNDTGCESATDDDESNFPNQEFGGETGQPVTEGACVGFTTGSVQQNPNGSGLVIVGTNGNDALQGSDAGDLICALDGDDAVQGHGGNDTIHGGGGKDAIEAGLGDDDVFGDDDKDVILGDDGNDELNGGQGNDNMSGGGGEDVLRGQGGWDTLKGNAHDDLMIGARGNDILQGGGGHDVGRAGAGDDVLKGYVGNDELRGGGGEDLIRGSAGRDRLFGNAGNDVINGGPGKDRCRGGRGRDILRNC